MYTRIKYMLEKISIFCKVIISVLFLFFSFVYTSYACPTVTPEQPKCHESTMYDCDSVNPAMAAYFDIEGPGTWYCGQCLDGDFGLGGFDNISECCGNCLIPNTGTINVSTNISASWTITGPHNFGGSGTSQSEPAMPIGAYTITFGAVAGYVTPPSQTFTLTDGGTISFSGTYTTDPTVNIYFSYQEKIKDFLTTLF